MRATPFAAFLAFLVAVWLGPVRPAQALDAIPLYEPISIGAMLRATHPTAGISSAAALNEQGDAVGRVVIDNQYQAFVYTDEPRGVQLLPPLDGWASHVAVDVTDRAPDGSVLIVGAAQTLYGDPDRAVLWIYDAIQGVVIETVEIGLPAGSDWSTATAVNNRGLVVGYGRSAGWLGPYQPFVYDVRTRTLYPLDLPFNPIDINALDVITGGTHRAQLVEMDDSIVVASVEDLSSSERPGVSRTTALNDLSWVVGVTGMGYSDGAGRMVSGAVRYIASWEVLWANSAYDTANDVNLDGDVVGSIGVSSAIRPFLYIEALGQGFRVNDLVDPSLPGAWADYGANAISDAGWILAGASGAVLFRRLGDMPPPTAPANLTAVPHEPTWQQPWNAISLAWQNTSGLSRSYTVERSPSGAESWEVIRSSWVNLQYNDTSGELGVLYDYRVRAEGLAGRSEPSNVATARFPSDPVDRVPPVAVFVAPVDGAEVSGNVPVVVEFSDDRGLEYVEISVSPSSRNPVICSQSPGGALAVTLSCTWRTKRVSPGSYTLAAYAYDALGNWTTQNVIVTLVEGDAKGGPGKGKGGGKR